MNKQLGFVWQRVIITEGQFRLKQPFKTKLFSGVAGSQYITKIG